MALETRTVRVCDVCGEPTDDGAAITFGWMSAFYETDLCAKHRQELTALVERVISSARRLGVDSPKSPREPKRPDTQPTPKRRDRVDTAAIRAWAKGRGIEVNDKGRLPDSLLALYASEVRSS